MNLKVELKLWSVLHKFSPMSHIPSLAVYNVSLVLCHNTLPYIFSLFTCECAFMSRNTRMKKGLLPVFQLQFWDYKIPFLA